MSESLGKILKRERESRNIPLGKVSSCTKVKEHHLKAIEEGQFDLLPHPLYVKGYLRSYSRCLGLDEKEILHHYEDYLKSLLPPEPPAQPIESSPPPHNSQSLFTSLLITVFLLLASILAAYLLYHPAEEKASPSFFTVTPATAIQREGEDLTLNEFNLKETPSSFTNEERTPLIPALEIVEAGLGTGIEKENDQQVLTGSALAFQANHQRGYFFTRIKTPDMRKIAHVWLFEGKEYHRIEMEIKPPIWSVFSYLTFRPQHTGDWKAEVREGDQTLASLNFKVLQ